jgi:Predicted oxidoreductases (related to aryl-alcohol dehydrogenases)
MNGHKKSQKLLWKLLKKLLHSPAQIALNWTRQRDQIVIPIIGARTPEQLKDSLGCIEFEIPKEAMERLNEVSKIELGFPHEFLTPEVFKNVFFGGETKEFINHKR